MAENKARAGTVIIDARKRLTIGGVKEVVSFDDTGAVLVTDCGELTLGGSEIKLSELTGIGEGSGEVSITGRIDALIWREDSVEKKRGLRARLWGR